MPDPGSTTWYLRDLFVLQQLRASGDIIPPRVLSTISPKRCLTAWSFRRPPSRASVEMNAGRASYLDSSAIVRAGVRQDSIANTMQQMGADLARVLTYDERMADAAAAIGLAVVAPS